MRARYLLPVALAVSLAACNRGETREQAEARFAQEAAAARQAVEGQAQRWMQHANAGHADSLAMLYTENANVMPPNAPMITGRTVIGEFWANMIAQGVSGVVLTPVEIVARGPIAIERGTYTLQMGAESDTGKYLVHWHHVQGQWLIADDIWNSDQAAGEM